MDVSSSPGLLDNFGVRTFSLCLGAVPGSDGYIIWNDNSIWQQRELFTRVKVLGTHTWSVRLENVQLRLPGGELHPLAPDTAPLGRDIGCTAGCSAIIDSGTSLLTVPRLVVEALERTLADARVDCSDLRQLPELAFELGGAHFSLPPDAYVSRVAADVPNHLHSLMRIRDVDVTRRRRLGRCQLLLLESSADAQGGPLWVLGLPFFRKYYTSFDVGASHSERAIYVASASDDCTPVDLAKASPARDMPYTQLIDPRRVHVPQSAQEASSSDFVRL